MPPKQGRSETRLIWWAVGHTDPGLRVWPRGTDLAVGLAFHLVPQMGGRFTPHSPSSAKQVPRSVLSEQLGGACKCHLNEGVVKVDVDVKHLHKVRYAVEHHGDGKAVARVDRPRSSVGTGGVSLKLQSVLLTEVQIQLGRREIGVYLPRQRVVHPGVNQMMGRATRSALGGDQKHGLA